MYPVNQVFLGNSDPLLSQSDITSQMQILKQYEAQLAQLQKKGTLQTDLIWDDIDKEMSSLTESQKARFFEDQEYSEITASLQQMVQVELLNLVKAISCRGTSVWWAVGHMRGENLTRHWAPCRKRNGRILPRPWANGIARSFSSWSRRLQS